MHSRQVVAVNATSNIYSLCDLNDKCIAVQNSSKPEMLFLTDAVPGVSVKKVYSFSTMPSVFAALKKGYVDACAGYSATLAQMLENSNVEYRFLEEDIQLSELGVAFYPGANQSLCQQLNQVLEEMRTDGTTRKILERYGIDADRALGGGLGA